MEKEVSERSVLGMVTKSIKTIGLWVGRGWKAVSYSIGSLILFFIILGFLGGLALPTGSQFGGRGINEQVIEGEGPNKVAVIRLTGLILSETTPVSPLFGGMKAVTPEKVRRLLEHAAKDEKVKSVVLFVDSPGGSAVASDMVFEEIAKFKEKSGKPVVVQMGDTAASGGYYISAVADRILANEATLTGSIGVIAKLYSLAELFEKIGIKAETFKKGEYKDILSESRERTEEEREILERILEDAYELFLRRVAEGRSRSTGEEWTIDKVRGLADGKIYSGTQAVENGLVDKIGNLSDSVKEAKSLAGVEVAQTVEYTSGSFFEQLFGGVGVSLLGRFTSPFLDPTPRVMYLLDF